MGAMSPLSGQHFLTTLDFATALHSSLGIFRDCTRSTSTLSRTALQPHSSALGIEISKTFHRNTLEFG